jgi:tetratricopeptide (TPR) repeat protein
MTHAVLRWCRRWGALLALLALAASAAAEDDAGAIFLRGVDAYRSGDFEASSQAFESLVDSGIQNGRLFYNLGNAYLKQDRLGYAVLWYERALRLMPHDPDLRFNYEYALSLTRDERSKPAFPLARILFFWNFLLSPRQVQWIAVALNAAFWMVLIFRQALGFRRMKTLIFGLMMLAAVAGLTAAYNAYEAVWLREGVILADEAPVRSGLTEQATELFRLHAGAKVRIDQEKADHYRIRYSEEKIGWIQKADVGAI